MIHSISCLGFRGFSQKQTLRLAEPNGLPGSGLTVLVGPNGGGKSTLVECFNMISLANKGASFSRGKRNLLAGDTVDITIAYNDEYGSLQTINKGSETIWSGSIPPRIYYLPSRRYFNPYFGNSRWDRNQFIQNPHIFTQRTISLNYYTNRLIDLNSSNRDSFNEVMARVLGKKLLWTIDQEDNGQYIVKVTSDQGLHHNSDGLGEGVISLMFIVDALCGDKDELIVIDEPELSLHPQLQNRLLKELLHEPLPGSVSGC